MGLTEVIGEVRQDGEARAKAIVDEAHAQADKVLAEARQKAEAYHEERMKQAEKDAAQLEAQILSGAQFGARKLLLTNEAEMREELRQTLLDGFGAISTDVRKKHVAALVKQAKGIIGKGTVYGAKTDEAPLKTQRTYTYGGATDIVGGIVVESEDGLTRLDLSYETILSDVWRDVLRQEAGLFE